MEEQIAVKEELALSELFKILKRRALVLILALVIGAITGGFFGLMRTWNVDYFGSTVEFYVYPTKIASSEEQTPTDEEASKSGASYGGYSKPIMESIVELLESESFAETLLLGENEMPDKGISAEIDALIDAGDKQGALEAWRKTEHYRKEISLTTDRTTFYYTADTNTDQTIAKSFIFVKISVLNDKDKAEELINSVKNLAPKYIVQNMVTPQGHKTNCLRITRLDDVDLLNPNDMLSISIKYALLMGALTFIAACVTVVAVDYSDKHLRDFEHTMERLNVPVLGVIPTIVDPVSKIKKDKEVK